jgi:hypothetical protein
MPSLAHYMAQYDHEHESIANKLLHAIRIPLIFAGIILLVFMKVDLARGFFSWRVGAVVSRTPDGGKSSGVFSGTDLFARWANLGRSRSLDVSLGNKPQADLRRYPAKLRLKSARRAALARSQKH